MMIFMEYAIILNSTQPPKLPNIRYAKPNVAVVDTVSQEILLIIVLLRVDLIFYLILQIVYGIS